MKKVKFDIREILPIAIILVVAGIGIAYGLSVMGDVKSGFVTGAAYCNSTDTQGCGAHYNATNSAQVGVATIATKLPLIATIVVAAIVIGILVRYLFVRFG